MMPHHFAERLLAARYGRSQPELLQARALPRHSRDTPFPLSETLPRPFPSETVSSSETLSETIPRQFRDTPQGRSQRVRPPASVTGACRTALRPALPTGALALRAGRALLLFRRCARAARALQGIPQPERLPALTRRCGPSARPPRAPWRAAPDLRRSVRDGQLDVSGSIGGAGPPSSFSPSRPSGVFVPFIRTVCWPQ